MMTEATVVMKATHYGLRAHHLKTRKITAALWTYNMGKNWYSCLLEARKYMVLPPP